MATAPVCRQPRAAACTPGQAIVAGAFAAVLVAIGCGGTIRFGQLDPPVGRHMVVDVEVHGNNALSDGEIEAGIRTHSDNFSLGRDKPLLDLTGMATDAQRIERMYAGHGYFQARVVDWWADRRDDGTARAHFRVQEGRPAVVRDVKVRGMEDAAAGEDPPALERLRKVRDRLGRLTRVRKDEPWNEVAHEATKTGIRGALRDRGFVYAEVTGEVRVSLVTGAAVVDYTVDLGPLARVRSVEVVGNRNVPAERVLRRVDIEPGQVVDAKDLRRTEARVFDLGVFFSVAAEAVTDGEVLLRESAGGGRGAGAGPAAGELIERTGHGEAGREGEAAVAPRERSRDVVIRVTVQEMQMHEVRVGGGGEIDNARGEVHLIGGYQQRNFLGDLRFFDARLQPGVVFLPNFFEGDVIYPGGKAEVTFRQPSFLEELVLLSARARYELRVDYGFKSHGVMGSIGLSRMILTWLRVEATWNVEFYRFFDVVSTLDLPTDQLLGLTFRDQFLLTYFQEAVTIDLRDGVFDPRNGYYHVVTFDQSAKSLGSDFSYLRFVSDMRGYWTPWRWLTIAGRFRYGQTFNPIGGETPLTARFLGGGLSDHRGFAANRMGPYLCGTVGGGAVLTNRDRCPGPLGDRAYIGGNLQLLWSLETRLYLPANFGLIGFADLGEVFARKEEFAWDEFHLAVGPGLRYFTPVGPVRADFGVRVTGPDAPVLVFHIGIGQAF